MSAMDRLAWDKQGGLMPAIVQDADTLQVLMLGYMNAQALQLTQSSGFVTFYSRSRQQLWVKGERSGNRLQLVHLQQDCDADTLLVMARPEGPTCHLGSRSCFGQSDAPGLGFLAALQRIIALRVAHGPSSSYTATLVASGIKRIAQKVGEEGLETALAAVAGDAEELSAESADLLYHLLVLLKVGGVELNDVIERLRSRHRPAAPVASI